MNNISFGATYRIPITQAGVNSAKKAKLKTLIESYPNGLIGKSKAGHARISVPDSEDASFIAKLKTIGYKVFQKFEGDNIPKDKIDVFIKEKLDAKDFEQKGKQAARLSKKVKEQRHFDRTFTPVTNNGLEKQNGIETVSSPEQLSKVSENVNKKTVYSENEKVANINPRNNRENNNAETYPKGYLELKEEYGEAFANAVFFGVK